MKVVFLWLRLLQKAVATKTSELFLPTLQHPPLPEDDEELCKKSIKKTHYHYRFMLMYVKENCTITAKI